MAPTTISPSNWNLILERIKQGRCVPFLGAGVNVRRDAPEYEGLPLGKHVAARFFEDLTGGAEVPELPKVLKKIVYLKEHHDLLK